MREATIFSYIHQPYRNQKIGGAASEPVTTSEYSCYSYSLSTRRTSSVWLNSARPRSPSGGRTSTPTTTEEIRQYTGSPSTAPTRHTDANPFVDPGRALGGGMKHRHKPKLSSNSIMNCFQHTPGSCGALHSPCGGAPHKESISPQTRPNRLHSRRLIIKAPYTSALAPYLPFFA